VQLAKKLAGHLPSPLDCTYFVSSGSEAIEGAIKLAKRYTGRTEVISFKDAYHGGTHGALSILGSEGLKYAFRPLLPDVRIIEFDDMEALEQITEKTACVVAETIQAEAGIILPRFQYMKALRERCTETGTLLVIDDIQMGMGRTGKLFSFENYDIQPDILALAKAFGGGMPLGAFISSREIMRSLTSNPELGHITTFGGHPVSCAAGLASLEVILKENLPAEANRKGLKFHETLKGHPAIKEIRYRGLMMAVDVGSEKTMQKLFPSLIENGLIVDQFLFNRSSFRIAPPLVISDEEIGEICQIVHHCLESLD
jgi:acetylornithine/succinyldiaminopimelate/putrescine aminotransferase